MTADKIIISYEACVWEENLWMKVEIEGERNASKQEGKKDIMELLSLC